MKKLQLRSSFASPALYFPECVELIKAGVVNTKELITHTFSIGNLAEGIVQFRRDKATGIKAVMVNE